MTQTHLTIQLDGVDPLDAYHVHDMSVPWAVAIGSLFAFAALPVLVFFPALKIPAIAMFVFFAVAVVRRHIVAPREAEAAQAPYTAAPYDVSWNDAALTITRGQAEARVIPWADLRDWKEGEGLFLLYLPGGGFVIVPKRFFEEGPSIGAFRRLLREKCPAEAIKPARAANRTLWMQRIVKDAVLSVGIAAVIVFVISAQ